MDPPGKHPKLLALSSEGPHLKETPENLQDASDSGSSEHQSLGAEPEANGQSAKMETINVTLHGATNLPARTDGSDPWPYVVVKTSSEEMKKVKAKVVTSASTEPTRAPLWGDTVSVDIPVEDVEREELFLKVLDQRNKERVLSCRLPFRLFRDFHPYHLELLQPTVHVHERASLEAPPEKEGPRLYVTVERRRRPVPGRKHVALEVVLRGITEPLADSTHPLVAVLRVVPNYKNFRNNKDPAGKGLPLTTLTLPPTATSLDLPRFSMNGFPQLSSPRGPPELPEWNQTFLFQSSDGDGATEFSENAALVVEFYASASTRSAQPWALGRCLGVAMLPFKNRLSRWIQQPGKDPERLPVERVPIMDSKLKTVKGGPPTVELSLKLMSTQKLEHSSPERSTPNSDSDSPSLAEDADAEATRADLGKYQRAMHRMAEDLLSLRREVAALESENRLLRRQLRQDPEEELGQQVIHSALGMTLRDRVQQLQNELIRKNDREKELLQLLEAEPQGAWLRRMQLLEETVRHQEKVIQRMEQVLEERLRERAPPLPSRLKEKEDRGEHLSLELYAVLLAENSRLRAELDQNRRSSGPIILQQQALPDLLGPSADKLSLLAKLERAQSRVLALESQLETSARHWGREKQDMAAQLLQEEYGLRLPRHGGAREAAKPFAPKHDPVKLEMKTSHLQS